MLHQLPPRDPKEPLDERHLRAIAESSLLLTQTIRDYLPVAGSDHDADLLVSDREVFMPGTPVTTAVQAYERIELLRNPSRYPWPGPVGSYMMIAPETAGLHYQQLEKALQLLVKHYGWEHISDSDKSPTAYLKDRNKIKPIDPAILRMMEAPAKRLLELTEGFPSWDWSNYRNEETTNEDEDVGAGGGNIDDTLAKLEPETPPFDPDSGKWVRNKRAAAIEGIGASSLATYRYDGEQNADKTFGRDPAGRIWRRPGTPRSHPWYLRSSLLCK